MSNSEKAIKTTYVSIFANAGLALVKFAAGVFGNSYALIADALESTTDVLSSLLVLFGLRFANKPADKNHPYGHGKAEPLITFIVVVFLVFSAVVIAFQSIRNIQTPHSLPAPYTLIVLAIIILLKEIFYRFVSKRGKETNSTSLKADAFHHRSDAITSFAAFIGILVALILGEGYESADDWAALLSCVFILYNSYRIFRPALGEIMDEHYYDDMVMNIKMHSLEVKGILDTEKCHIRKAGLHFYVDLHIIVNGGITVHEGHKISHELKDHLLATMPELTDVLIHVEPDVLEKLN
jgi:cation diffusion facilitator family transporter